MKTKILALLFLGLICSCKNDKKNNNSEDIIEIAATLDFTGPNSTYGEQVKEGVELALEEINQSEGVSNKIDISYLDSKSDPKLAVSNAQRFISVDDIKILLGEISSNATQAIIPVVEKNQSFLFAPASSSPKLSGISENFARNWPSDISEAISAANYASKLEYEKVTIVYVNSDYGIGLKNKFQNQFLTNNGIVVSEHIFDVNEKNFRNIILKMNQESSDVIYLAGNPKEMGVFIKQLREYGNKNQVISNTGFLQNECLELANNASEGTIVPTPEYNPKTSSKDYVSTFYNKFYSKYKKEPTMVNANGYDAIHIIKQAVLEVGNDPLKISNYIRNLKNYKGAAGLISFTDGDVESEIVFKTILNGKIVNLNND